VMPTRRIVLQAGSVPNPLNNMGICMTSVKRGTDANLEFLILEFNFYCVETAEDTRVIVIKPKLVRNKPIPIIFVLGE